ncbi:hypothetical protein Tco_0439249 [Tanacetum coccineum]
MPAPWLRYLEEPIVFVMPQRQRDCMKNNFQTHLFHPLISHLTTSVASLNNSSWSRVRSEDFLDSEGCLAGSLRIRKKYALVNRDTGSPLKRGQGNWMAIPDAIAWRHHDSDVYDAFPDNDFSIQDDFPGFFPVFKDTGGNVVTMSEYLCFSFLSGVSIVQGAAVPANHLVGQNTTLPLPAGQPTPDKTDSQREVEVEDPKVVAAREKKKSQVARAAVKKKEYHVSSPVPLRTVAPANQVILIHNRNNDGEPNVPNDENRSASHSPHGSVSESVHHFVNVEEKKDQESPPRVEPFVNLSGQPIHLAKEPVFLSETNADRSSHPLNNLSTGSPMWAIPLRCRVDTPERCRELMVHLAPPAAQEESNALTNEVALQRAWFNVLKEEHTGCGQKVKDLEEERNSLSVVNRDQALRIKELEAEVAKKDSAFAAAEQMSAEGAQER